MLILSSNKENFINIFKHAHLNNEPVIFPTDTIYGIGAFFDDEKANEKIFKLKNRDYTKPFPVLISDLSQLDLLKVTPNKRQILVLEKYWPGRFTFLFRTELRYNYCVLDSKIAVRMIANSPLYEMIKYFNRPITATSANLSNQPYSPSIMSIIKTFSDKVRYFIVQKVSSNNPSTIIDLTEEPYSIIRNPLNIKLKDL